MTSKTPRPFFLLILPELKDEKGHVYEYALSLQKAFQINGWKSEVAAPADCTIKDLPTDWKKALPASTTSFWSQFQAYYTLLQNLQNEKSLYLFLEHFRLGQLFALFMACLTRKGATTVCLLHRYAPKQMKCKAALHHFLYRSFSFKLRFKFLTDSRILQKKQEKRFKTSVQLLPIPHTSSLSSPKATSSFIDCWWPGGSIRESKGLFHICQISKWLQEKKTPLRLIVAKQALRKGVLPSDCVLPIADDLCREDYEKWMHQIQVVLLPYDPQVYHSGTSGIFVEAVCAGAIPLVTEGTWMAQECERYALSALIVPWTQPALLDEIPKIVNDLEIRKKLQAMQKAYLQYHCLASFSKEIKKIAP